MAVTPVTRLLGSAVIGQKSGVNISFIGVISLSSPACNTGLLHFCCISDSSHCAGCVILRMSEGRRSSCRSVGQVQFGSGGTVIG